MKSIKDRIEEQTNQYRKDQLKSDSDNIGKQAKQVDDFNQAYSKGTHFGIELVIEILRSKEAENKCITETKGTCEFVSHSEWADWIEKKVKK